MLDHLSLTADMHFSVWTSDDGSGHLLECGLDRFSVVTGDGTRARGLRCADLGVFPNPSSGTFRIDWSGPGPLQATVFDMQGRAVSDRLLLAPGSTELNVTWRRILRAGGKVGRTGSGPDDPPDHQAIALIDARLGTELQVQAIHFRIFTQGPWPGSGRHTPCCAHPGPTGAGRAS